MTNSWSLLYEEMNEEDRIILSDDPLDKIAQDTYDQLMSPGGISPAYDDGWTGQEVVATEDAMDENSIDLNLESTSKNRFWKYEEDLTLKEIRDYLSGTYKSHYTSQESKTQTLDLIESIGDAEPFCRSNAIKYLSRFGKKNGKSKLDILKAIHYCILLYHFSGLHTPPSNNYETF